MRFALYLCHGFIVKYALYRQFAVKIYRALHSSVPSCFRDLVRLKVNEVVFCVSYEGKKSFTKHLSQTIAKLSRNQIRKCLKSIFVSRVLECLLFLAFSGVV